MKVKLLLTLMFFAQNCFAAPVPKVTKLKDKDFDNVSYDISYSGAKGFITFYKNKTYVLYFNGTSSVMYIGTYEYDELRNIITTYEVCVDYEIKPTSYKTYIYEFQITKIQNDEIVGKIVSRNCYLIGGFKFSNPK